MGSSPFRDSKRFYKYKIKIESHNLLWKQEHCLFFFRRLFGSGQTKMANIEPITWEYKTCNKNRILSQVCNRAVQLSWLGPKWSVYICWPVIHFCYLTSCCCTSQRHLRHLTSGFCFTDYILTAFPVLSNFRVLPGIYLGTYFFCSYMLSSGSIMLPVVSSIIQRYLLVISDLMSCYLYACICQKLFPNGLTHVSVLPSFLG